MRRQEREWHGESACVCLRTRVRCSAEKWGCVGQVVLKKCGETGAALTPHHPGRGPVYTRMSGRAWGSDSGRCLPLLHLQHRLRSAPPGRRATFCNFYTIYA